MHFDSFWGAMIRFQHLLTIFLGQPVYPQRLLAEGDLIQWGNRGRERIQILLSQPGLHVDRSLLRDRMLLSFASIQHNLPIIVDGWYEIMESAQTIVDLLAATFYGRQTLAIFHFLATTQVIDGFHRNLWGGGTYVPEDQYPSVVKTVYDAISAIPFKVSDDHREKLYSQIRFGNDYALRKRLKELLDWVGPNLQGIITRSPGKFVSKIIATRNQLTHYGDEFEKDALSGADVYYAFVKLQVLVTIILLKSIGVPETLLVSSLSRNRFLNQIFAKTSNI